MKSSGTGGWRIDIWRTRTWIGVRATVFLEQYLAAHPEAMVEPEELVEGEIIVRVNNLVGITENPGRYAALREECIPVATIGHAYLLYRVPCAEKGALPPG